MVRIRIEYQYHAVWEKRLNESGFAFEKEERIFLIMGDNTEICDAVRGLPVERKQSETI